MGKLPGVTSLDVNLIDGTMTVQFDPGQVDDETIIHAVRRAGLEGVVVAESCPSGVCAVEEGWWAKRGRGRYGPSRYLLRSTGPFAISGDD